jgi:hypothetical protein
LKIPKGQSEAVNQRTDNTMSKKDKRTNNDLQNITQKTKYQATQTPLKTRGEVRCSRKVSNSCSTCDTHSVTVKRHEHHLIWKLCWKPVYVNKYNSIIFFLHKTEIQYSPIFMTIYYNLGSLSILSNFIDKRKVKV